MKPKKDNQNLMFFILILGIILLLFNLKAILLFLIPGIILILNNKKSLNELIAYVIGISLSFWIFTFWLLKYIPLRLTTFFYFVVALTLLFISINFFTKKKKIEIKISKEELLLFFLIIFFSALRLIPFFLDYFPAGADMSFNTLTTKIIVFNNKFPETYAPVLPTIKFGAYPAGFHIISAYLSLLSGIPEYKATLFFANFTYAFLAMTLFIFLLNFFNSKIAFFSSIICLFLTNNPQFFISWGGNTFLLSLCFIFLVADIVEKFLKNKQFMLLLPLLITSSFLTYFATPYGFIFLYAPFFVYKLLKREKSKKGFFNVIIKKIAAMLFISLVLLIPFVIQYKFNISERELKWSKQELTDAYLSWHGTLSNLVITLPIFMINLFGNYFMLLVFLGFLLLVFSKREHLSRFLLMLIPILVVIINSRYEFLPFTEILYPDRISILLLIPFSILIGIIINILFEKKELEKSFGKKLALTIKILFLTFIIFYGIMNYSHYLRVSRIFSMVTHDDLEAFRWIEENSEQDDLFLNNYGDAGLWISPITLRKTRIMHLAKIYADESEEYLSTLKPKYIYFGKKKVYSINLDINEFAENKDKYEKVYEKNGVYIFKIKN